MVSSLHPMRWRQTVAMDIGTATTRIAAGESRTLEHRSRLGSTSALSAGVVVDGEALVEILQPLIARTKVFGIVKPCVLACAPSDAREEERELLVRCIVKAGAASVSVIPEPLAAAVGSGIDISSPYAQMVLDIGEGVTDCAVIRSSRVRATCAIRTGCARMRRAVISILERNGYGTMKESEADALLRTCGISHRRIAANPDGTPVTAAVESVLERVGETVDAFLRDLPHEFGCEIIESGIRLTGGGALIPGLREYFERRTGITVAVAHNPLQSVVEGARAILPVMVMLNGWK